MESNTDGSILSSTSGLQIGLKGLRVRVSNKYKFMALKQTIIVIWPWLGTCITAQGWLTHKLRDMATFRLFSSRYWYTAHCNFSNIICSISDDSIRARKPITHFIHVLLRLTTCVLPFCSVICPYIIFSIFASHTLIHFGWTPSRVRIFNFPRQKTAGA